MALSPKVQAMQDRLDMIASERRRLYAQNLKDPLCEERRLANEKAQRQALAYQQLQYWERQQMAAAQNAYGAQLAHQVGLANSALYWLDPVGCRGR